MKRCPLGYEWTISTTYGKRCRPTYLPPSPRRNHCLVYDGSCRKFQNWIFALRTTSDSFHYNGRSDQISLHRYYVTQRRGGSVVVFGAFGVEGRWFESHSGRHVGTLDKSFTRNCLSDAMWHPAWLPCG